MCEVILVWFEVPVDDAIVVEILQSQYCLCKVHPGHIHRQGTHVLQKGGAVSTCKDQWRDRNHCSKSTCFQPQFFYALANLAADLQHIP